MASEWQRRARTAAAAETQGTEVDLTQSGEWKESGDNDMVREEARISVEAEG